MDVEEIWDIWKGKPPQNFPTIFFQLVNLNYIASYICATLSKYEKLQ